jgi:hypothetical protein
MKALKEAKSKASSDDEASDEGQDPTQKKVSSSGFKRLDSSKHKKW